MKVFGKERKKQLEQMKNDLRDARAFSLILWFVLNVLHGPPWNWAEKRLQRVYDATLELIYSNRDDRFIGDLLENWAVKMGLTESAFWERKKAKEHGELQA